MADELRRGYHDRLASVHDRVTGLVQTAAAAVGRATTEMRDSATADGATERAATATQVAAVEQEIFDVLATQAPVGRDLRLLLASLRVAHEADMSEGLAVTIAGRAAALEPAVAEPSLAGPLLAMGTEASGLLDHAGRAFAVLDGDLAQEVVDADAPVRESHRGFLAALYTQHALPVGAAVECGVVARCYERIADHALEIAQRVRFVATGP